LGNQNKWWLRKPVIIATHKKPDEDAVVAVALLKMAGVHIKRYWFFGEGDEVFPNQIEIKNLLFVDRGRRDFDHHGIKGKTSAQIVAEELEIANEKWLRPILAHVQRVDLEGRSEQFDLNDMLKAIAREENDDYKIMELGLKIAEAIIKFHKNGMKRNNERAAKIILDFFGDETKMPKRVQHYFKLLQNPNFVRPLDFVELATVDEGLAREVLKFILSDIRKYIEAEREIEKAQKIEVLGRFIVVGESDNPKFNVKAREWGAAMVVQRNKSGHVQIFFNNKILAPALIEKISEDLIEVLRLREISLGQSQKLPVRKSDLRKEGRIEEVPEWYFFKGEKGGSLLLNGSLTSPNVTPTKIPLEEIAEIVNDALRTNLEQMGRGTARKGIPFSPSQGGGRGEIKR
jgi:hypothetical protein